MKADDINKILGIKESFRLPERMMDILFSNADVYFEKFMQLGESLDHDWFTEYFEEEHANKSKMAQDFTPAAVCDLLAGVVGKSNTYADVCAGTGGLSIGVWRNNPEASFVCYELSERAIPLLLFNLAIRNISAKVCRCDLLTGEEYDYYEVKKGEKFGTVHRLEKWEDIKVDAVVSNPPYSLKYDPKKDTRFEGLDLPTSRGDYVFVAFALSILKEGGTAGFILPHGVLFRGQKEAKYREKLIKDGVYRSVIGIPGNLFLNTSIPTCINEFRRGGTSDGVFFIDAKDEYEKVAKINKLIHIDKILEAWKGRKDVDRFAHLATMEELEENDYNLNIPRYVDTTEPEPDIFLSEVFSNLADSERKVYESQMCFLAAMMKLTGTNDRAKKDLSAGLSFYEDTIVRTFEDYKKNLEEQYKINMGGVRSIMETMGTLVSTDKNVEAGLLQGLEKYNKVLDEVEEGVACGFRNKAV